MNSSTITVHWHNDNQPVYSVDFQPISHNQIEKTLAADTSGKPSNESFRLATGGGDNNVRIWHVVKQPEGKATVEYLSSLAKHTQAVNVVRFNPNGDVLATAGDDGTVILWELSPTIVKEFGRDDDEYIQESWVAKTVLTSSASEIYDLSWSPNGKYLATGSMDHYIRIYRVENSKGELVHQGIYHQHYIQGLAWDPLNEFLVSQSADRTINVIKLNYFNDQLITTNIQNTKVLKCEVPINKLSVNPSANFKTSLMYHSETLQSFFRRLTFSPDGSLLLTPLGVYRYDHKGCDKKSSDPNSPEKNGSATNGPSNSDKTNENSNNEDNDNDDGKETNSVFVFIRTCLNKPVLHIPGFKKAAIAVSFSPIFYKNPDREKSVFKLPYKMIFAIATQDSIIVYDTASLQPLGVVSNIHYSTITDLAWDQDGQSIIISSADGFCSTVHFDPGVFGGSITRPEAFKLLELQQQENTPKPEQPQEQEQQQTQKPPEPQEQQPQQVQVTNEPAPKPEQTIDVEMEPADKPPKSSNPQPCSDEPTSKEPSILNLLKKKDKQKKRIAPTLVN